MANKQNSVTIDFLQYKELHSQPYHEFEYISPPPEPANNQIYIIRPDEYEDAQVIVDDIAKQSTVIINLKKADYSLQLQIMNFVFGACYCLGATICPLSPEIFVISPGPS